MVVIDRFGELCVKDTIAVVVEGEEVFSDALGTENKSLR